MLSYSTGAGGIPAKSLGMAEYLVGQMIEKKPIDMAGYYYAGDVPREAESTPKTLVELYGTAVADGIMSFSDALDRLMRKEVAAGTVDLDAAEERLADALSAAAVKAEAPADSTRPGAEFRADTHPALAAVLGIDPRQTPSVQTIANLMSGLTGDGQPVPGKQYQGPDAKGTPIGYIDLTWSPHKSISVAWAFAEPRERQIIFQAHKDAVDSAMQYAASLVGRVSIGKARRGGDEAGHVTWISFDHYTSRPTLELATKDAHGREYTKMVPIEVPGDPQPHTHAIIPNVVRTDAGRVGSLNLGRLNGRVKELGGYYQAHLATNLRRNGIEVVLDAETGAARIAAIPSSISSAFSKRHNEAHAEAKKLAASEGVDWDALTDRQRIDYVTDMSLKGRQAKKDGGESDEAAWQAQAEALGWKYTSVLRPGQERDPLPLDQRVSVAYDASLPRLDVRLQHNAVLTDEDVRITATQGLIVSGITGRRDIDRVTAAYRERGVTQDGQHTALVWAPEPTGRHRMAITTALHESQELEVIERARRAAADGSGALRSNAFDQAVNRSGLDFTASHGTQQLAAAKTLAHGGRLGVVVGVAGSGKSAMLKPLVDAWSNDGRHVIGLSLAWRQTEALADAGITERHALHGFLIRPKVTDGSATDGDSRVEGRLIPGGIGKPISLGRNTVVVVDEVGQVGTRQLLDLLRLRDGHGFSLVLLGDPKQCQSIEAGPVIDLLHRALPERIPEMLITIRQDTERERAISGLFRDGKAEEALQMKRQDGTAQLVAGSYKDAVDHIAALWLARTVANAHDPTYSLSVMAPTNADARAISGAIREQRRAMGEVGEDAIVLRATDQRGEAYDLPLAVGDKVRLFQRVAGLGSNGSVLTVVDIAEHRLILRDRNGKIGSVSWDTLRDQTTREARIKLAHGDVLTIDAGQGITATEHIDALPGGTSSVTGFKAYVTESRHRRTSYMVVSDGAERKDIARRRPIGDPRPVREGDVWESIAKNLSRQPTAETATGMMRRLTQVKRSASRLASEVSHARARVTPSRWERSVVVQRLNQAAVAVVKAGEALTDRVRASLRA